MCGNNVKFVNTSDKRESILPSPGDGVGALTVNTSYSALAFAELKVNPRIFIYVYPDFSQPRVTLEGEFVFVVVVVVVVVVFYKLDVRLYSLMCCSILVNIKILFHVQLKLTF